MDFYYKKLPLELFNELRPFPVSKVKPYQLLLAPVYVFLHKNSKFLALKGPLDFFTEQEMEKYSTYEVMYFHRSIELCTPFVIASKSVKDILSLESVDMIPSYELSDSVLRLIGPLWSSENKIEPYFINIFVDELCAPLGNKKMEEASLLDVDLFECALLQSSWAVFLALHLGYCNLNFLNKLRLNTFDSVMGFESYNGKNEEVEDLISIARSTLKSIETKVLYGNYFDKKNERVCKKMSSKINRIQNEVCVTGLKSATIFGKEGAFSG